MYNLILSSFTKSIKQWHNRDFKSGKVAWILCFIEMSLLPQKRYKTQKEDILLVVWSPRTFPPIPTPSFTSNPNSSNACDLFQYPIMTQSDGVEVYWLKIIDFVFHLRKICSEVLYCISALSRPKSLDSENWQ